MQLDLRNKRWDLIALAVLLSLRLFIQLAVYKAGFISLTADEFGRRKAGLISALLLSVNPAHIWLSGAPLTEMPNAMLVLAAIYAFSLYLKSSKRSCLFTAACILAVANGFRFGAWR